MFWLFVRAEIAALMCEVRAAWSVDFVFHRSKRSNTEDRSDFGVTSETSGVSVVSGSSVSGYVP
jgi:hypothetical protein